VIHSSDLARFLSFAENRELAREALQERGFKKVRLGIEAFPIDLIDDPNNASPSNVYRYEQRPFIFVSWEKVDILFYFLLFSFILFYYFNHEFLTISFSFLFFSKL